MTTTAKTKPAAATCPHCGFSDCSVSDAALAREARVSRYGWCPGCKVPFPVSSNAAQSEGR